MKRPPLAGWLRHAVRLAWFWITIWVVLVVTAVSVISIMCWDWLSIESNGSTIRNVVLVAAAMIGLPIAIWRSNVAERQAKTAQRGLLNERYQKGAEMLGSELLAVRLGGIYALARLAREHPGDYHLQIMSLLCAFVRHSKKDRNNKEDKATLTAAEEELSTYPPPAIKFKRFNRRRQTLLLREDLRVVMEAIEGRSKACIALERKITLVHPVNGEVPPVKGRPWKLPHYANRGKTSSSGGELASARSCFSTVRTALGKLRITGLLARFDVARSFPPFPRPLLLQPTIWTSERGADLGSGRCQPRPHLPIYRMTHNFALDFGASNLRGLSLRRNSNLSGANFTDLSGADFMDADLSAAGASLRKPVRRATPRCRFFQLKSSGGEPIPRESLGSKPFQRTATERELLGSEPYRGQAVQFASLRCGSIRS